MKKILSVLVLSVLLLSMSTPVYASFENPPIVDNAGYLMQSEIDELTDALNDIREKYDFDVAIYTETELSSLTAEASADDIYDYQGYGAGEDDDGIMLYICSDTREYHFTTHSKGIEYFNSRGLEYLESKVVPYLAENDYYEAFEAYIDTSEELLEMAKEGKPFNQKQYSIKYLVGVILVCFIAPLLIAFFMMKRKLKKMKTAVQNDYAANYIKPGSLDINVSKDLFLYSTVNKTEKAKSNSGIHTSSSGRTHGGSGGNF